MGIILEVEIPPAVFQRQIQPFGAALAEVSWRMKMFTHEGTVLSALLLQELNLAVALSFWADREKARRYFKDTNKIDFYAADDRTGHVSLVVGLDEAVVDALFVAAELVSTEPSRASARRAEKHFGEFLGVWFPQARVVWSRGHHWREGSVSGDWRVPVRVG
jgi:hypothetical protein